MRLPNAQKAIVPIEKVRDYLLSREHPDGRSKALVFDAVGFNHAHWWLLQEALLQVAHTGDAEPLVRDNYGQKFKIHSIIQGPNGRPLSIETIWLLEHAEGNPRFITAYPTSRR